MMAAEVLAVTLLLLLASSCRISYKLNGAALDYTVYKTSKHFGGHHPTTAGYMS